MTKRSKGDISLFVERQLSSNYERTVSTVEDSISDHAALLKSGLLYIDVLFELQAYCGPASFRLAQVYYAL